MNEFANGGELAGRQFAQDMIPALLDSSYVIPKSEIAWFDSDALRKLNEGVSSGA